LVRWLWHEQPTSSEISAILNFVSASSFIARLTRQRTTYWCGVMPVDSLKRRPKLKVFISTAAAISFHVSLESRLSVT
jgi:hypothetical protein